jgi:hypothetical protein
MPLGEACETSNMSGGCLKHRVTVNASGQESELFAIEERENGELLIFEKRSHSFSLDKDAASVPLLERRHTIHLSPKNLDGARTIICTTRLADGRTVRSSALVHPRQTPVGRAICWPLFASAHTDLSQPIYKLRARQSDVINNIASYNTKRNTLLVYVIVTGAGLQPRLLAQNFRTLPFRVFWLHIVHTFLPIPSTPFGYSHVLGTSIIRINGKPTQNVSWWTNGVESPDDRELSESFRRTLDLLSERQYASFIRWTEDAQDWSDPDARASLKWQSRFYLADPVP